MKGALVVVAFFVVAFFVGTVVRNNAIDNCRDRGGRPVTYQWYQESYWSPGCVEP